MKLGFIILYVPNVLAAVEFYERAFGLERRFVHAGDTYAEMETGETALAFASEESVAESNPVFSKNRLLDKPAGVEISFIVADVKAAYSTALAAGAKSHVEPKVKPWEQTVAYVRDLNGFLVELCSELGTQE